MSTRHSAVDGAVARPSPWNRRTAWGLAALLALAWSLLQAGVPGKDLVNAGGWVQVEQFLEAAFHPALGGGFLELAAGATLVTLAFAVCGTVLSLILGLAGGVLASRVWWRALGRKTREDGGWSVRGPWLAIRGILAVPRAIHEIVWGLLLINLVGLDPVVGVMGIAIPYGAMCAKVFSEILDETDPRAMQAFLAGGAGPAGAMLYGLFPRALPDLASYAFYRFECSIRSAAVLGIIGAGGLGYQIFLSLQSLRYEQMWTFLFALILLTGLTDLWSGIFRRRLGFSSRIELDAGAGDGDSAPGAAETGTDEGDSPAPGGGEVPAAGGSTSEGSRRPSGHIMPGDRVIRGSLVLFALLVVFSFWYVGPHFGKLVQGNSVAQLTGMLEQAFPPGLGRQSAAGMLSLSLKTVAMSLLAIVVAGAGGMLFSFPAANNFLLPGGIILGEDRSGIRAAGGVLVFGVSRLVLLVLRAIPAPITALILLYVFFPGILPGALALGLYTMGVLGRLMAEVTENLDRRPLQALRAQGASGLQVFLYGVLPTTLPRFLAYILYRWEVAIAATVMVGVVGAGGLGVLLSDQLGSLAYDAALTTLGCYVALLFLVDMVSATARRHLRG